MKFGYEISHPAEMEYKEYVDGSSGELKSTRTGQVLVHFEVWPPSECPRQPAVTTAREVGIERAKTITEADGPDGSSHCGDPLTVRDFAGPNGAEICERVLTCMRKTYPETPNNTVATELGAAEAEVQPVLTVEGTKGPAYFVDISSPWRKRILTADPVGVDPRPQQTQAKVDLAVFRKILETLKTFPIQKPAGVSIEDLPNRRSSIGHPPR